ncbi:MAG: UDP-N-acetylglucosamine--N-acetylmuramyl-(pentapeptide) pyrophosphoryl-undecaprenol N-acetylglucosamine transferase [Candidatus Komeilibacteria bacterium]|nr:UDP-N-acetylglucosamine--N-acetylmuramyl-(pentapeptide) pyrophosphoryl-undecaprenol N-acetylglucosamine transferase [Candidatus Komeilibacteria bacterium]
MNSPLKIILTGGGTLGSVSPLIAVWQELASQNISVEALLVGTSFGPEKKFLQQYPAIKFAAIPQAKLRRYFSLLNLLTPLLLVAALIKSFFILHNFKPDLIISAGGFTGVPIIWLGKMFGYKIIIHQLDLQPTLSNKLTQSQADLITVTFDKSLNDFPKKKTVVIGPLLRQEAVLEKHHIADSKKTLLVLGGGTGALSLNKLIVEALPLLNKDINVFQVTGQGKKVLEGDLPNYRQVEFLTTDYYQKISQADLVLSRAGLSTLLELSYFAKPVIIVALPNSHQEVNAGYYEVNKAAINLKQTALTPPMLAEKINELFNNQTALKELANNIKMIAPANGAAKMVREILKLTE